MNIYGTVNDDQLLGTDGDDYIDGKDGNDSLLGGLGADRLIGSTGNNSLFGEAGDDSLEEIGSSGNNVLDGGDGNDRLFVRDSSGRNTLSGGNGDDYLYASGTTGDNSLNGGDGNDHLYSDNSSGTNSLVGGSGIDYLYTSGSTGKNSLDGGDGDDRLIGGNGNNVLIGGPGADSLEVIGTTGNNNLEGGDGDDKLYSNNSSGTNSLVGGSGDDYLQAYDTTGKNSLDGGDGNDKLYSRNSAGTNSMVGGSGDDYLSAYGSTGDNNLGGGDGDDILYGGSGDDTLDGGSGFDQLHGGDGNDRYLIRGRDFELYDSEGIDTAIVSEDFAKIPYSIENISYVNGAKALPYWIDSLLASGAANFATLIDATRTIGYTFPSELPGYDTKSAHALGFTKFNAAQIAFSKTALTYVSTILNLSFVETSDAAALNTISFANNSQEKSAGYARYPDDAFTGSDLFLSINTPDNLKPRDGEYSALTLIHELGHALGLKHPFSHPDADGDVGDGPYLPDAEENSVWTVMSYTKDPAQYHLTYNPLDIAALQYLYGPSKTARSGDDTYKISATGPNFIWDGDGSDTVSASSLSQNVTLYLEPGYWGFVGSKATTITSPGQVTVNFGTVIENLIGGKGNDTLFGNSANNKVDGLDGNDSIDGGDGDDVLTAGNGLDTMFGGGGNDVLYSRYTDMPVGSDDGSNHMDGGNGDDHIYGGNGNDTLIGGEGADYLTAGNGRDNLSGGDGNDTLYSRTNNMADGSDDGANSLDGGNGNDQVYGGNDNDTLTGGEGDDILYGGLGVDTAIFSGSRSQHSLISIASGWRLIGPDGTDTLTKVEYAKFLDQTLSLGNFAPTGSLVIAGTPTKGRTLNLENTLGDLDGLGSFNYQWSADGTAITGATSSTLTLADAQIGKTITVTASYTDGHGTAESVNSSATPLVTNVPPQVINGSAGNDSALTGGQGNDTIDGKAGIDTAVYTARMAAYTVSPTAINGPDGSDSLVSIERLQFLDANLAFDLDGNAGQTYRLYQASFNRTPDLAGLGGWIAAMDNGTTPTQVATSFMASAEFQSLYGANPSNEQFVSLLFTNALHRTADAGGLAYWVNQLTSNLQTRAQALVNLSESAENKASILPAITKGIVYANATQAAGPAKGQSFAGTGGDDSLIGSVGNDTLSTGAGNDSINAGFGDDGITGGIGNDTINGGGGLDTAIYSGKRATYTASNNKGALTVSGGTDGADTLSNVERLKFDDALLAFDTSGNAGQTYRLYQAAFNRTPDKDGLSGWVNGVDSGMTMLKVAAAFIDSGEFKALYGTSPSDSAFVNLLYNNALHRPADAGGLEYWVNQLNSHSQSREQALLGFSESAENQAALIGVIQGGIELVGV
jgi:Ca2+-binding RTX toxin-like protein